MTDKKTTHKRGRASTPVENYHTKIDSLLDEGFRIDDITATKLVEAVGGQYRRVVTILEDYKAKYSEKKAVDVPEPPAELMEILTKVGLDLWETTYSEKIRLVGDATLTFENEKKALIIRIKEYLDTIEKQEDSIQEKEDLIDLKNDDIDELEKMISDQEKIISKHDSDLELSSSKTTSLESQLKDAKNAYDALQAELIEIAKGK